MSTLTVREFAEWLNNNRDAGVSAVFHDIVAHYTASTHASTHAAEKAERMEQLLSSRVDQAEACLRALIALQKETSDGVSWGTNPEAEKQLRIRWSKAWAAARALEVA